MPVDPTIDLIEGRPPFGDSDDAVFATPEQWLSAAQSLAANRSDVKWRGGEDLASYIPTCHFPTQVSVSRNSISGIYFLGYSHYSQEVGRANRFNIPLPYVQTVTAPTWIVNHEGTESTYVANTFGRRRRIPQEEVEFPKAFGPYCRIFVETYNDFDELKQTLENVYPELDVRWSSDIPIYEYQSSFPAILSFTLGGSRGPEGGYWWLISQIGVHSNQGAKCLVRLVLPGEDPSTIKTLPELKICARCRQNHYIYSRESLRQWNANSCTHCNGHTSCCCSCRECEGCGEVIQSDEDYICSVCDCCESCCDCERCPSCGDTVREGNICDICDYGVDCGCCRCGSLRLLGCSSPLDQKTWPCVGVKGRKEWSLVRMAGVELEVNELGISARDWNRLSKTTLDHWTARCIRDGSLGHRGFEIATAPAGGDLFIRQLEEVCKLLGQAQGLVNANCGAHVHINAIDMTWYDIRRIGLISSAVEPALFNLCHPSRQYPSPNGQHYCRPWGSELADAILSWDKPKDTRKGLFGAVYKDVMRERWSGRLVQSNLREATAHVKRSKYGEARYKALNLHSYVYRGTLEFRHFHGSIDFNEVSGWAKVLIALVSSAYAMDEKRARACYFAAKLQNKDTMEILKALVSEAVRGGEKEELVDWINQQKRRMYQYR